MSDIEFEDSQNISSKFKSSTILGKPQTPSITSWLLKFKVINDEKQAWWLMWFIIIFCFTLSFLFLLGPIDKSKVNKVNLEEMDPQFREKYILEYMNHE